MSYSVTAKGATKNEALGDIIKQLDEVVGNQPTHAADIEQVKTSVDAFVKVLPEAAADEEVSISANGYLSWQGDSTQPRFTSAHFSVTAGLVKKGA
jgi:hypothetical protein